MTCANTAIHTGLTTHGAVKCHMAHPLDGAVARIQRANRHIDELISAIECFRKACENNFIANQKFPRVKPGSGRQLSLSISRSGGSPIDVPHEISAIIGDIIHNLRAALDYLVFELALKDSGFPQDGTQFIIEDVKSDPNNKKRGFDPVSKGRLRGLSNVHVAAIERLQPYMGALWTKALRNISNLDKHRKLISIGGAPASSVSFIPGPPGSFKGRPGTVFPGIGADGEDIYMEGQYAIEIQFTNGTPVLETLQIIQRHVAATIDSFKFEF
jgi:hypothetical protein